jgi:methyl-accepting chemotaxis protein
MKIRLKILLGFIILAVMLIVAGVFSIHELTDIGASVQHLLDDNYQSINAAKIMIEGLERQDSGVLLLLSGQRQKGRTTILAGDTEFAGAYKTARSNLTIPGEAELVTAINDKYKIYKSLWNKPLVENWLEGDLNWYFTEVHTAFQAVKAAVQELMTLNDKTMYQTASSLKNRARRAAMPGIVAIVSALVMTLMFNFFINLTIVNPLLSIIRSIRSFVNHDEPVKIDIENRDEIGDLAVCVREMAALVRKTPG